MSLQPSQEIELQIEKPAAGGRMIARYERQVVLVLGAIPGERVLARISRVERQVAFGDVLEVLEPSPDRREMGGDPRCGGCLYAHVSYGRGLELKGEVIADAFARLGRIPLPSPVPVDASPDRGYRMRARLHVRSGRVGFYREGTHELCDAAGTGQLSDEAVNAAQTATTHLAERGTAVSSLELTENMAADQRVLQITASPGTELEDAALDGAAAAAALSGLSARTENGRLHTSGVPIVSDSLNSLTAGRVVSGALERHAESFFQANRFLLPSLVQTVLDAVPADGDLLDLYAGVGLFSVALAATGRTRVTAVEGDRSSGKDLQRNAAPYAGALRVSIGSVEEYLTRRRAPGPATIIVDPPRTGISREAMQAVVARGAPRVVYVSCDPATMARDARRLLDGGYRLTSLRGFDLFPNTPHVEAVGVFDR